jgi:catechol 2,3-dioxygenase-like lactoylglutathione lyase family enzyme
MEFLQVRLHAPAESLAALADFYAVRLGFESVERPDDLVAVAVGETRLEFVPGDGRPFYHFALLAPGNRFEELRDWAGERTELLPDTASGEVVFDFSNWSAHACYFHDPAGNIVEVIAHDGVGESNARGAFAADELLGLSELGLVGDQAAMAALLRHELGLVLWDGTVEGEGVLAFVGEPARTLILAPVRRPWLPTGRPAEAHPVDAVLSGLPRGEVVTEDSLYRIRGGDVGPRG